MLLVSDLTAGRLEAHSLGGKLGKPRRNQRYISGGQRYLQCMSISTRKPGLVRPCGESQRMINDCTTCSFNLNRNMTRVCVKHEKRRYPKLNLSCPVVCGEQRPFAYFSAARLAALVLCCSSSLHRAGCALRYANTRISCSRRIHPWAPGNCSPAILLPRDSDSLIN